MFTFAAKHYTNSIFTVGEKVSNVTEIKIKPEIFLIALICVYRSTSYSTDKTNIIRLVRDASGIGLKDAKDAVEAAYEALEQINWSISRLYSECILPVAKMIK